MASAALTLGLSGSAWAFHSGGVAECEGCHTMHNSKDGNWMGPKYRMGTAIGSDQIEGVNTWLLQGSDASSTCLNCHQHEGDTGPSSYHVSTPDAEMPAGIPPKQRTPGGDFGWLKKDYTWVNRNSNFASEGERHGHNIVAADYGYMADTELTQAPGGQYPAANLSCISCHDPHPKYRYDVDFNLIERTLPIKAAGSYNGTTNAPTAWGAVGVYRILGGVGYVPKSLGPTGNSVAFNAKPPFAIAPSTYNQSEATNQVRVAYGSGMSEWCGNCHYNIHANVGTPAPGALIHPAGTNALLSTYGEADIYNAYVKSGNLTGSEATAYSSLVPFEEGLTASVANKATLNAHATNAAGLTGNSYLSVSPSANVMCLSCHRAHASGNDAMTRWNQENEFLTVADANGNVAWADASNSSQQGQAQGRTTAELAAAVNDRPVTTFAPYQRNLCNKCHAKD